MSVCKNNIPTKYAVSMIVGAQIRLEQLKTHFTAQASHFTQSTIVLALCQARPFTPQNLLRPTGQLASAGVRI